MVAALQFGLSLAQLSRVFFQVWSVIEVTDVLFPRAYARGPIEARRTRWTFLRGMSISMRVRDHSPH